jgi:hypothetical protein
MEREEEEEEEVVVVVVETTTGHKWMQRLRLSRRSVPCPRISLHPQGKSLPTAEASPSTRSRLMAPRRFSLRMGHRWRRGSQRCALPPWASSFPPSRELTIPSNVAV